MTQMLKIITSAACFALIAGPGAAQPLREAIQSCWLPPQEGAAAQATVVVGIEMRPDRTPKSTRLIASDAPTKAATDEAYQAARRAIIRCGQEGFPLPVDEYEQWREIEITFEPMQMGR